MNQHPYIGLTFSIDYELANGRLIIARAVCVALNSDTGAAVFRDHETGRHHCVHLAGATGPRDEPSPPLTSDGADYHDGAMAGINELERAVCGLRDRAVLFGNSERVTAYDRVLSALRDLRACTWQRPSA